MNLPYLLASDHVGKEVKVIASGEKLHEVIEEYADDQLCREVVLFLEQHPRTRFSRLAIVHALNGYKWCTEQALNRLTDDGVVKRYNENGVPLYSLGVGR
jgi:hypothetical protein